MLLGLGFGINDDMCSMHQGICSYAVRQDKREAHGEPRLPFNLGHCEG